MKPFTALREVDADAQQRNQLTTQLSAFGYAPDVGVLPAGTRFLQWSARFVDQSSMVGYVDIAQWVSQSMPHLAGIDWLSIDDALLPSLLSECPLQLDLRQQHATTATCEIHAVTGERARLRLLPRLAARDGWVWVESFQPGPARDLQVSELAASVPVTVTFLLGSSTLAARQLPSMEVGDVLRINNVALRGCHDQISLFAFALQQDAIMIEDMDEQNDGAFDDVDAVDVNDDDNAARSSRAMIDALPIDLTFVLMEKSVKLADLNKLVPGTMLEIPDDQIRRIEVRANRTTIAHGELVQLADGQLGVEIHRLQGQP